MPYLLLFLISAVGVLNATLLFLYWAFKSRRNTPLQKLESLWLLCVCVRVGTSCFHFFQGTVPGWVIQLGLTANLLFGPVLLTYHCLSRPSEDLKRPKQIWFLLLGTLALLLTFNLSYSFADYPDMWDHRIRYVFHSMLILCLGWIGWARRSQIKAWWFRGILPTTDLRFLVGYTLTLLLCTGFAISLFVHYVLGPVFATLLFYGVVAFVFWKKTQPHQKETKTKLGSIPLSENEESILKRFQARVQEEQLYALPGVKVQVVAEKLQVPPHVLSRLINTQYGKSFSAYLNEQRVEHAKSQLIQHPEHTVEGIGFSVGFQSKSSFYAVFRKVAGCSPTDFRKRHVA